MPKGKKVAAPKIKARFWFEGIDDCSASTPCFTLADIAMLIAKAIQDRIAVTADMTIATCLVRR